MLKEQSIIKFEEELTEKDIRFSHMQNCVLKLYGSPSALHLEKLESCKVFCGPVSGSVFINDCKDSVFVFPCQQLRIHNTISCHFYVHVTSRSIIEDSADLGFAEFNWCYEKLSCHFQRSRLDPTKNNWQSVDDFNWLRTGESSPNWFILSKETKVSSWD